MIFVVSQPTLGMNLYSLPVIVLLKLVPLIKRSQVTQLSRSHFRFPGLGNVAILGDVGLVADGAEGAAGFSGSCWS